MRLTALKKKIEKENIKILTRVFSLVYQRGNGGACGKQVQAGEKSQKGELKTWFEKGTQLNTLFNMDRVNVSEPMIICEGEIDCLSLLESDFKNAVSVPTGASSSEWVEVNYDFLEQFGEIILWFDNDEAGLKGIRNIAPRLPSDIVKVVNDKRAKDINELLFRFGTEVVGEAIENAQEQPIENVISVAAKVGLAPKGIFLD